MFICAVIHFPRFVIHSVAVYVVKYNWSKPTSALHDVLVWYIDSVQDGCAIMAQVMESEMWDAGVLGYVGKAMGNHVGRKLEYFPDSTSYRFDNLIREMDIPV